jgi:hypothetical protein
VKIVVRIRLRRREAGPSHRTAMIKTAPCSREHALSAYLIIAVAILGTEKAALTRPR